MFTSSRPFGRGGSGSQPAIDGTYFDREDRITCTAPPTTEPVNRRWRGEAGTASCAATFPVASLPRHTRDAALRRTPQEPSARMPNRWGNLPTLWALFGRSTRRTRSSSSSCRSARRYPTNPRKRSCILRRRAPGGEGASPHIWTPEWPSAEPPHLQGIDRSEASRSSRRLRRPSTWLATRGVLTPQGDRSISWWTTRATRMSNT